MEINLNPIEERVLGAMLEKHLAVPATYPLTLNALLTACNQSTSREPVMNLTEAELETALESLKATKLVRRVLPSSGSRVVKYRQVLDEVLPVDDAKRALLALLMVRGPQTVSELTTRTARLHDFGTDGVEPTLEALASWASPLVTLLPRSHGQREPRWKHLLGDTSSTEGKQINL